MRLKRISDGFFCFLLVFFALICESCGIKENLIGKWQWVSYDMSDSLRKASLESEIQKFEKLVSTPLITNAIKNTSIEFYKDGLYEFHYGGTVKGGKYQFVNRKTVAVPYGVLKSKSPDEYRIMSLKNNRLVLQNTRHSFVLHRFVDKKFEENRNIQTFDFSGVWNNKQSRKKSDNFIELVLQQKANVLKGKMNIEPPYGGRKGHNIRSPLPVTGEVTGNLGRIQVRQVVTGQSSFRTIVYHIELEYENDTVKWKLLRVGYEDKNGETIYRQGSINPPFPYQTVFKLHFY
jgi:hypothetical protein